MDRKAIEREVETADERVASDKLIADLKVLAVDMERLLKTTGREAGQHVAEVRAKAEERLIAAKARLADLQDAALAKTRAAGQAADSYARANPWRIIAFGALAGLLFGLMLARDGDSDAPAGP